MLYAGRAIKRGIGRRLGDHTTDRLQGRWNRFSWFGFCEVGNDGTVAKRADREFSFDDLIVAVEAVLIEGMEPRQNRKAGDARCIEYRQVLDPQLREQHLARTGYDQ